MHVAADGSRVLFALHSGVRFINVERNFPGPLLHIGVHSLSLRVMSTVTSGNPVEVSINSIVHCWSRTERMSGRWFEHALKIHLETSLRDC